MEAPYELAPDIYNSRNSICLIDPLPIARAGVSTIVEIQSV